jgi:hypothetical protein
MSMLVHPATTPVRPASNLPAPDRKAARSFADHVGTKTRAADSGHAVTTGTPAASGSSTASQTASASSGTSSTSSATENPSSAGVESSLDQSEDQNMQFLELQSQVSDQSTTFTTLSNVMKTENDTLKNTSANMAI